jgi:hypothetical protein
MQASRVSAVPLAHSGRAKGTMTHHSQGVAGATGSATRRILPIAWSSCQMR